MTWRHAILPVFLIAGAACAAYANTFNNAFHFDDIDFIVNNSHLRNAADVAAVWHYWPTRFIAMWTFAFNVHAHGLDVRGFHGVNLAVHAGCAVLVWTFFLLTMKTPALRADRAVRHGAGAALLAALIFAVHPVQTEAVTYIYQRCASLAAFFYLLSLVLYIRARLGEEGCAPPVKASRYYAASLIMAILAAFTKEHVVTLPLVVALYEWIFFKQPGRALLARAWPYGAVMLLLPLALFSSGIAQHELEQYQRDLPKGVSTGQYLMTEFRVVWTYVRLLFFPVRQNLDYDYPITRYLLMDTWGTLSFLMIAACIGLAVRERIRRPLPAFGILWFFITSVPESSVFVLNQVIFEHRLYLPMVGFLFALVGGANALFPERRRVLMWFLFAVYVAACAVLTVKRNEVWRDGVSLWSDCIRKSPRQARPYANRGRAYGEMGEYTLAINDLTRALEISPDFPAARRLLEKYRDAPR